MCLDSFIKKTNLFPNAFFLRSTVCQCLIKESRVKLPAVPCRCGSYKVTLGILGLCRKGNDEKGFVCSQEQEWPLSGGPFALKGILVPLISKPLGLQWLRHGHLAAPTSHGRNSKFYTETPVPGSDSADGLESLF